jgi:hypothetical protein
MVSEEQRHSSDENNAFRGGSDSSQIKQVRLVQPDRRQLSWTMLMSSDWLWCKFWKGDILLVKALSENEHFYAEH